MNDQHYRILILDVEEDALLTLQHTLENAGADTTITWDETEARQLVERKPFDLIIVGDHPPEIRAESILHDSSFQGARHPCLILLGHVLERDIEHFRRLGAMGVIPKREPLRVLEQVRKHWSPETVTGGFWPKPAPSEPPLEKLTSAGVATREPKAGVSELPQPSPRPR